MAAAEVQITVAQAEAIADRWSRRAKHPVTVRQEDSGGDISVWLPNYSGTKQSLVRIKPDGKVLKGVLTKSQNAAIKQSRR